MTPLDPDKRLALTYVPAAKRAAVASLWHLDAALGAVVSQRREPMISRIKLAWWREALEKLDHSPAPAEPTLQAAADHLLTNGISGAELASMEEGWAVLLNEDALNEEELQAYASARGASFFGLTARLLGSEANEDQLRAGQCWALANLARHSGEPDASTAASAARELLEERRWPSRLRPLGMLAALARRDLEREVTEAQGAPGRMLRMLAHRITGR